jgi:predicted nucleic acid-binding protein
MILADTTVWIDHLRGFDSDMGDQLQNGRIAMHPFVAAELALGSLKNRQKTLATLDRLLHVPVARLDEVRQLIESRGLYVRGIGLTDAHLAASCLITPGTQLWTRDKALRSVAVSLGIQAQLT